MTRPKIGEPFPGYLTFANGVVGAFYLPSWDGPKRGLSYHDRVQDAKWANPFKWQEFGKADYALIVLAPAVTGLLFVVLGVAVSLFLPVTAGRVCLLFFHFLAGGYLMFSPEIHLTYYSTYFHFAFFSLIPAVMIHFALLFPERAVKRHAYLYLIPYLVSAAVIFPYVTLFMRDPQAWIQAEYVAVGYVTVAYLFWIGRLSFAMRKPHAESTRILARYMLLGQLVAFIIPLAAALAVFVGDLSVPLNLVAPCALLFPASFFVGIVLARIKQGQVQLIQAEKRAALGSMLAGLAHEINNPMNFIYSNIEPLREAVDGLAGKIPDPDPATRERLADLKSLIGDMEEGANRAKGIVDSFRNFSHPQQEAKKETDLHYLIDKSITLLTPKWQPARVDVVRRYSGLPKFKCAEVEMGQVFVNLMANAIEAMPNGGILSVRTDLADSSIVVTFRDTGAGMGRKELSKVFDPFFTTKPPGEGSGLGLATSLEIVKKYRGTLEIHSTQGKGTEAVVTLPIH